MPYSRTRFRVALRFNLSCWRRIRTWKDSSGQFEVKATLIRRDEKLVYLKKLNGNVIKVHWERLTRVDQQFIETMPDEPFKDKVGHIGASRNLWCNFRCDCLKSV